MGSNLQYKGLKEVLSGLGTAHQTKKATQKDVNNDWKRLAGFMQGRT